MYSGEEKFKNFEMSILDLHEKITNTRNSERVKADWSTCVETCV